MFKINSDLPALAYVIDKTSLAVVGSYSVTSAMKAIRNEETEIEKCYIPCPDQLFCLVGGTT
jgi:hypothetical protein